ncbi:DUF3828 domain-containing protein [Caulobacter sp. KR2-114]|uniref:DUF3828 domain-containing protein n=1 Tax=Caulobacter sp. KR2-114 TaxID=3400912 RepID=UPI003BFD4130
MTRIAHCLAGAAAFAALAGCNKPAAPTSAATTAAASAPAQTAAAPAAGQDAADAKAFLEGLYANYAKGASTDNNAFAPMDKDAPRVFDKAMVDLLARDAKLNGPDEVGFIDGDWLCDCQDYDKITATVTVQSATATAAKAVVDFKVFDQMHRNAFDLVKEGGAWRVHDVQDVGAKPPEPSLRAGLEADIAQLQKAGKKKPNPDEAP